MIRTRRHPASRPDTAARLHGALYRWMPIVALVLGLAGFMQVIVSPGQASIGFAVMTASMACSVWLPSAGPLRLGPVIDEFDRALHRRAYLATFASIAFAAQIGILLVMALALLEHWPRELLITALAGLALLLPLLWAAMPTLYASWSVASFDDDE